MQTIPEAEAISLLSQPLFCEVDGGWTPTKPQPGTMTLGAGVLDEDGVGAQMYVELLYRKSFKTKITTYKFTIFSRRTYGKERVYQLDVVQYPRPVKDAHSLPHEHIGSTRLPGDAKWSKWGYDEVLAHFCVRTNVTFQPVPAHPEDFQLTGDK